LFHSWFSPSRLRLDRQELSGAFGDLGTDLPLLAGMVLASGMNAGWAFLFFGLLQIASAVIYGIPMPVQPLKAVAVLVIAQHVGAPVIAGGALAIAAIMLLLTVTGAVDGLARLISKPVVRGIQFGLGVKLGMLALGDYILSDGVPGCLLAGVCAILAILLLSQRRLPASVVVLGVGLAYALVRGVDLAGTGVVSLPQPSLSLPGAGEIWMGLVLLALPQVPLSLGNSLLATKQLADDWFPERRITLRKIATTYSLFNIAAALLGGIPVCHGSGGMAGHYTFGARTGGSVAIYGLFYVVLSLLCGMGFQNPALLFPLPMLGVILFFESLTLMARLREVTANRADLMIALVVGSIAAFVPAYGFLLGMAVGAVLSTLQYRMRAMESRSIPAPLPNEARFAGDCHD
jgi:hypothetical protein